MNKQIANVAVHFVVAAFVVAVPVLAETTVAKSHKFSQSDNLETTRRLLSRLDNIKELALENLKNIAPQQVVQIDNSLEQVKQFLDNVDKESLAYLSDAAAIVQSASQPKAPLVSPLQTR